MNATADHPLTGRHAALFEKWLRPNGIIGWMPEDPTIVVDLAGGTVTWPKWRHLNGGSSPWEKDLAVKSDAWSDSERRTRSSDEDGAVIDQTTTKLRAPVTDEVRDLARRCGMRLEER
jgi:hypothetical protein